MTSDDALTHVRPADNVRMDIGTPRTPVPASLEYEALAAQFRYSAPASVSLRAASVRRQGGLLVEDICYSSPLGGDVPGWLLAAEDQGMRAAILLLHSSNGNRDQLLSEAEAYARRGAVCLAITAAHSRPGRPRFPSYTVEDREDVVQTVIDLRAGLDLLLLRGVDPRRLGFVGFSYGADYGAVFCAVDRRLSAAAFISGGTLRDYFARSCPEQVCPDFLRLMDTVSPDRYLPAVAGTRLLFQNGRNDKVYTQQEIAAFCERASAPKVLRSYDTDHWLNDDATQERLNWLSGELNLLSES